ncbi:nitrile hydratase accessory protein [Aminobacter sp. MSH1]|uniref:nitrile hydratase accessory protein n=1 Tax=Aminobacter sp. MSH1 TaxID=374606 RepID=UPI000D34BEF1|nr:nitrile hydratase accessory protein [Aminobacter sp. MSH1]
MVPDFESTYGLPRDHEGPTFKAPWEASAFAIAVKLSEDGHFIWSEWVDYYSGEIRRAEAEAPKGQEISYYHIWLSALERLLAQKGLVSAIALEQRHLHLVHERDHDDHDDHGHQHVAHREPVRVA